MKMKIILLFFIIKT